MGQIIDGALHGDLSIKKRQHICNICKIIELIYQCSKDKVELSFQRVGLGLLDSLSAVLSIELERHCLHHDHSQSLHLDARPQPDLPRSSLHNGERRVPIDTIIKSVTRIVCSFARAQSATTAIARHTRLIALLCCIAECSKDTVSFESQHNCVWTLANIACERENCLVLISTHERLLRVLVRVASDPGNMRKRNTRSIWSHSYQALQVQRTALRCILNLSYVERTADEIMPRSGPLLASFCQLVTLPTEAFRDCPRVCEMIIQIKRYCVCILHNLSNTTHQNKCLLSLFRSGLILRSLAIATRNDGDVVFRRKATLTLANLVQVTVAQAPSPP